MASLTKKQDCKNWIAVITTSDGRRTNRSTGTADKKEALKIAIQYQDLENQGKKGKLNEITVRNNLNEILKRNTGDELNCDTVEEFLKNWINGKENQSTKDRYQSIINEFLKSLGKKSSSLLNQITHKDVIEYIKKRENESLAPKTIKLEVKIIGSAFNVARKMNIIESNPVEKALLIYPINGQSVEKLPFSVDELKHIINQASVDWKTLIIIGYYTGARLSDCSRMKWSSINFATKTINFKAKKTGNEIKVPIHETLLLKLENLYISRSHSDFVIPNLCENSVSGKNGLSTQFTNLLKEIGIDPCYVKQGKRQVPRKSFHSIRHSWNTHLANKGVSQEIRTKMIGHASKKINDDYTHIEHNVLSNAIMNLPKIQF